MWLVGFLENEGFDGTRISPVMFWLVSERTPMTSG